MSNFEDLQVWSKAIDLSVEIYSVTKSFPSEEIYGLTSQARRASCSVASNIAEGSERGTDKDFSRFLGMALGSLAELKTQIIIANRVKLLSDNDHNKLSDRIIEIRKMLKSLKKSIKTFD
jgi:four helix bundle protein